MIRPARAALRCALLLLLAGLCVISARADGLTLTASFGLSGRYRPGAWCPVTVRVQNPGSESVSGQIQALATPASGQFNYGGAGGNAALGAALFARPVSLSGSASQFVVYARGINPGRDSVTVQLVEGQQRGDGRILARADNEATNPIPTITGTPLSDSDLFLVGFAGDPGAFLYLSGRNFGLAHLSGGGMVAASKDSQGRQMMGPGGQIIPSPGTAQVVSPAAADLPDKAAGYSGVDAFLLRGDAPLDALTEAQEDALKGWVASGGHLIVFCNGIDPSPFASAFFTGLLPATVGPAGANGALTLTPKPLPGVQVAPGPGVTVTGPYGAGRVTLTTSSSATAGQALLTAGGASASSLLSHVATREENYATGYYGPGQTLLSDAVMRAPSLDAPGTEVIGLFLLVYLIALVPANYLILKRMDRKELAWVTIPALVVIFALGTFGVGYAAKGGAVFLNRAAIIETASGQREAGVYAELGLFSPHRTTYDITVPGANALAALPNPGLSYNFRSQGGEMQASGQTKFVQSPAGAALLDTSVNMWAMRAFDTQSTTDLGGTIDSTLTPQASGVTGAVTNHTTYDLTDCVLLYRNQFQTLGSLARGASVPLFMAGLANNSAGGLYFPRLPGEGNSEDSRNDIRQRMRWALASYVRLLGQPNGSNYYMNGQAPPAYAPSPGEALLIGWCDNPALAGPSPQIDGHSVRQNDVSLVVVHLPIGGK